MNKPKTIHDLDTPQLLLDLDGIDANLARMFADAKRYGVKVRVHFKSLKCTGLARYIAERGADGFLCAKLNEAENLVTAGLTDVMIANQVVGPGKLKRLAELALRANLRVCVDDFSQVDALAAATHHAGSTLGVLIEVDIGMNRCGVQPGEPSLLLAEEIQKFPSLKFVGLQGYDGHLQTMPDPVERERRSREATELLVGTRRMLEQAEMTVDVVTGGGTGTWEFVASTPGVTEIQPGSFILMDTFYHSFRPEFGITQSILTTVISRRPGQYVLDIGSKGVSQDFARTAVKSRPGDRATRVAEEHTVVETGSDKARVGDRIEVYSGHCCATMNLHRTAYGVRGERIETIWPIEASGRYD
jgi:D-serine deaminase-like pyridoxal phosphate-dependent protein